MKCIYTASNLPDAHLVRDLLAQAGIPAHIFNANGMSALGELPMSAAYPQVWIVQRHQEQHARSIIADYQRPTSETAEQRCQKCKEDNPGSFELCWCCGAALPQPS